MANIVENQFDEALSSLLRIETGDASEKHVFPELWSQLVFGMARTPDDVVFISAYYRHRQKIDSRQISRDARLFVARRLVNLGFGDAALEELGHTGSPADDQEKLLYAQAALAARDVDLARLHLRNVTEVSAKRLSAELEENYAKYEEAAKIYAALGDVESQINSEWRAGNWDSVAQIANGSKKAAAQLMTATEPYELSRSGSAFGTSKSEGVMAANDAKLQHSEWVREMLELLLSSAE